MLIIIQRRMPWINGFIPTARCTSVESDAPIKNIVSVRQRRAIPDIAVPTAGIVSRMNVLSRIATMKYRINHGTVILRSLRLNMNEVARANDRLTGI